MLPPVKPPSPWRSSTWSARLLLLDPMGRYVLAAVFLMAALTKFADLPGFRDRLVLHSGLPYPLAFIAAHALPSLELTCGFCLLLGVAVSRRHKQNGPARLIAALGPEEVSRWLD